MREIPHTFKYEEHVTPLSSTVQPPVVHNEVEFPRTSEYMGARDSLPSFHDEYWVLQSEEDYLVRRGACDFFPFFS